MIEVLTGDCRKLLAAMPAKSVHCCVTSPPYFGLRDYGTAAWAGGDPSCEHKGDERVYTVQTAASASSDAFSEAGEGNAARLKKGRWREGGTCRCGAVHSDSQIGLEKTPDEFVAQLVAVFREVRRVLRDDGTLWINLGDSYSGSGKGVWNASDERKSKVKETYRPSVNPAKAVTGLKPKDLIGIPWMVAFALRADGWYLRQDIIWAKPNPMPESVTDRCTKAHEYIFLLSKSPRYFYDADAIAEAASYSGLLNQDESRFKAPQSFNGKHKDGFRSAGKGGKNAFRGQGHQRETVAGPANREGRDMRDIGVGATRNKRSVWTVATAPYADAHFATFPPALIEPCILAGCPVGGTVLDPFGGAGTTGLVADRLQRSAVLIELNPEYAEMARRRIHNECGAIFGGCAMTFTMATIKKLRALGLDEVTTDKVLEIFEEAKLSKPQRKGCAVDREARGTRLPETWVIPTDWMERAKAMGLGTNETNREAAKFKNYWLNQPGQRGLKLTWPRTWENWCISTLERAGRTPILASDAPKPSEGPEAFTDATWRAIAKRYKSSGNWSPEWGSPPSSMGCLMPVEYL